MDNQTAFNKAYLGLKAQGFERSANPNYGLCLYRGPNGLKCAIGHIMSNEQYSGESVRLNSYCIELGLDYYFAKRLQLAHDNALDSSGVEYALKNVAIAYGLTIPE